MDYIFKIKNPKGLFSTGGVRPRFTKTGKAWKTLGHLKSHLTLMDEAHYYTTSNPSVYKDCVVVRYVVKIDELDEINLQTIRQ